MFNGLLITMDDEMEIWELEGKLLKLQLFLLFDAQKQEQWSDKKLFVSLAKPNQEKKSLFGHSKILHLLQVFFSDFSQPS